MLHTDRYGRVNDPLLVLCHGSGAPPESLEGLVMALAGDHRVLVPHFPGYSQTPSSLERGAALEAICQAVVDELSTSDSSSVALIGHSFGFHRAVALAPMLEARLGEGAISVVIGLAPASSFSEELRADYDAAADWARSGEGIPEGLASRWFAPSFVEKNPDLVNLVKTWWAKCDLEVVVRELFEPIDNGASDDRVREGAWPCALLVGSEDVATPPPFAAAIAGLRGDIDVVEVSGAGHFVFMENPEAVNVFCRKHLGRSA